MPQARGTGSSVRVCARVCVRVCARRALPATKPVITLRPGPPHRDSHQGFGKWVSLVFFKAPRWHS